VVISGGGIDRISVETYLLSVETEEDKDHENLKYKINLSFIDLN
jgi:hypothetical protein